jgi:polyhydroxybutyrate depolymerase
MTFACNPRHPRIVPAIGRRSRLVLASVVCMIAGFVPLHMARALAAPAEAAQLDFGGLARTYSLHVPPGVEHPAGLVVNLHAAGATGQQQAALTNYDAVADAYGFAAVYPDGVDLSWADGRGASEPDRRGIDDVGFLSALIGKLVGDFGIDPGHVYVTGLSAGAFMANRLACDRADLITAVAPVAGTLGVNVPCNPSRPVSVLQTHGTADPVVPYDGGPMTGRSGSSDILSATAMSERWRQIDGCPGPVQDVLPSAVGDGTTTRRSTSSPCKAGSAVVLLSVDGGGHTWPSAPDVLATVGSTTHTFNASFASWQFFAAHAR